MALPGADPNAVAEFGHFFKHFVYIRHDVVAVDNNGCAARRAQRYMQHRPVFGAVNLVAAKHGVDARSQAGLLRESNKELDRLLSDTILGVIEVNASTLSRQTLA